MHKLLIPKIAYADLRPMFGVAAVGGVIAGIYGIAHDQFTYSISTEYFTELKFKQFNYVDFGFSDRIYVCFIGVLATWWVGMVIAWFLARRLIPNQDRSRAYRQIAVGFAIVFGCGLLFGIGGYAYGLWRGPEADYVQWKFATQRYRIDDIYSFVRVAYIHNASYLGGLVGLILALIIVKPGVPENDNA